jgi:hypothetical protein
MANRGFFSSIGGDFDRGFKYLGFFSSIGGDFEICGQPWLSKVLKSLVSP